MKSEILELVKKDEFYRDTYLYGLLCALRDGHRDIFEIQHEIIELFQQTNPATLKFNVGQDVFVLDKERFRYSMGGGLDGIIKTVNVEDRTYNVLLNFRGDEFLMTHIPEEKISLLKIRE